VPLAILAGALVLLALGPVARAAIGGGHAAAATENALSTREALAQLKAGGNAVDAAVAAALVAGVASPSSSGIGGGGFAVVWLASERQIKVLDFRETAPRVLDVASLERDELPDSERGDLIGVPGEVKGLFELHQRHGKRSWATVVASAVRHASSGYPVGRHLAATLARSRDLAGLDAGLAQVFFAGNRPAVVGQLVKNPKLGATLSRIAAEGPPAFYSGPIAADLVAAAGSVKSGLSLQDLARYRTVERAPLHVHWEGFDVYTMPPPSAGGLMLAQTLQLFSSRELRQLGHSSGAYRHMIAEALRGATADRMRYIGDPELTQNDLPRLLAKSRMAERRRRIALDRTHLIARFGLEEHGTHHLVTADEAGNFVSLTTTVNRSFGAKVTGPASGVVLNDQLGDFTRQKDVEALGLTSSPNRPRPLARPVSSMTPTIVTKGGEVVLALGGAGGTTIGTNVTQLLLARLVFGQSPLQAVSAPRFYIPTQRASLLLDEGAPRSLIEDLESRGEIVAPMPFKGSAVQMIAVENGRKLAAADPRKHGSALVQ
jgi:gamma-glutamyltranspeptidase/glutathione hydrolase